MNVEKKTAGEIVKGRPVYFVLESDSVLHAAHYMTEHQIGAVPVLEEGYQPGVLADLVGIFSERDLITRVVASARHSLLCRSGVDWPGSDRRTSQGSH